MSTTASPTSPDVTPDPKAKPAAAAATMEPLYKELLKQAKAALRGAEVAEKKVYVRLSLNKKAVVYINAPGKKNVRVEIPNGSGGYEVIKVASPAELDKAITAIKARAAVVKAK